jgi:hypothetical protein
MLTGLRFFVFCIFGSFIFCSDHGQTQAPASTMILAKYYSSMLAAQARFWTEIYDGAKLFYLSGVQHGKYLKREVFNLARFISVMKLRPLTWRLAHPYTLVDRFEVRGSPE